MSFLQNLKNIFLVNYDSTKNMDNISVTIILKYLCMCIKASIKFSLWRSVHWFIPMSALARAVEIGVSPASWLSVVLRLLIGIHAALCRRRLQILHGPRLGPPWETGARYSPPAWGQGGSALPLKFVVPDFAQSLLGNHVLLVTCLLLFLHHVGMRWSSSASS